VACPSLLAREVVAVAGIKIHGGFPVLANRHRGFMREIRPAASLAGGAGEGASESHSSSLVSGLTQPDIHKR
jgi:hypothetical protein